jgi:integrase
MGRVYQPTEAVKDEHGNPVVGPDGKPLRRPRTKNWYIRFYDAAGKLHEKTGYRTRKAANDALIQIEAAKRRGERVSAEMGRMTFDEAAKAVEDDYAMNGRSTLDDVQRQIRLHLKPYFGGQRLTNITTDVITAYVVARQKEDAENATINRELSTLKRAFRLARRAGRISIEPYVPMLKERNTRQGFFERHQFDAVSQKLPVFLRPLALFYYWTGWRKTEALTLQIGQVDLRAGVVRLEPGSTKNRDGRQFHFGAVPELRDMLTAQLASAERLSVEHGRIVSHVFHRPDGLPIKSFRKAWARACKDAGCPTMLVHDFRRTAVRNLERAGVPRSVAMAMVGHKTEAIYRRYAIVDETMHREAAEKLNAFATGVPLEKRPATVRQFKRRAGGSGQ